MKAIAVLSCIPKFVYIYIINKYFDNIYRYIYIHIDLYIYIYIYIDLYIERYRY